MCFAMPITSLNSQSVNLTMLIDDSYFHLGSYFQVILTSSGQQKINNNKQQKKAGPRRLALAQP